MAKERIAAIVFTFCCIATPIFADQEERTVYYDKSQAQEEMLRLASKGQTRRIDRIWNEVLDSAMVLSFDGGDLSYEVGEDVPVKRDGDMVMVKAENVLEGDVVYLIEDDSIVEKDVEGINLSVTTRPYLEEAKYRDGWGMGVRIDGYFGYNQAKSTDFDGSVALIVNYDDLRWRFSFIAGVGTAKYGNLSQKANTRYLSPKVGAEVNYKFATTGDLKENLWSVGLGIEADYRRRYFEDEYSWHYNAGYTLFPNVNLAYTRNWFGKKSSISVRVFMGYRAESGSNMQVAHGLGCGVGITYSGLFTNKIK